MVNAIGHKEFHASICFANKIIKTDACQGVPGKFIIFLACPR